MYKIETIERVGNASQWVPLPGGEYNEWETKEAAQAQIPELVNNFGDCTSDDFRVVEIQQD